MHNEIHLRIWTRDPKERRSACNLSWKRGDKVFPRASSDVSLVTCNACKMLFKNWSPTVEGEYSQNNLPLTAYKAGQE